MNSKDYFLTIYRSLTSLFIGMGRTFGSMVHPSRILTQQYPENRATLYIPQRFRAQLTLLTDADGAHKCTACTLCQSACPNGSIEIVSRTVTNEEGKNRRVLERYTYHLGSCSFCGQCVDACNFDALAFDNRFESSEYIKEKLERELVNLKSKTNLESEI